MYTEAINNNSEYGSCQFQRCQNVLNLVVHKKDIYCDGTYKHCQWCIQKFLNPITHTIYFIHLKWHYTYNKLIMTNNFCNRHFLT